jgi:hypothetical protein
MSREEILSQLKSQSTWRLFFLSFITLGIYTAHYIKRQTRIMNQYLDKERRISEGFVSTILILAYVTVILVIPYVLIEEGLIEGISNVLDAVWSILVLVWAFKARNRMNMLLSATKDQARWFHGLWTFLFTALYFNFKINTLNESLAEKGATAAG